MVSGRAAERRQNSAAVRFGRCSRTRRSGRSQGARWNVPAALGFSRSVFAGAAARGESGCDQSAREELKRRPPPPSTADKRTPRSDRSIDDSWNSNAREGCDEGLHTAFWRITDVPQKPCRHGRADEGPRSARRTLRISRWLRDNAKKKRR